MAEQSKVILHGMWHSPFAKRVELALKHKGIPYEYVEEDLRNKSDLLLKYNPVHKKVPVLVHNGKAIAESMVILEYIDETWKDGPKLLPSDSYKRAQARFWSNFIQDQLMENSFLVVKTDGEAQQKAINQIYEKLSLLEDGMKSYQAEGNVGVENKFGILEIVFCVLFGPYKAQEEVLGMKFIVPEKFPVLFSWLMAIVEVEAVKKAALPHEKTVAILQHYRQSALKSSATP
ncbi:glutathione S-transferase U9 [Cajanus cajan]|uniref:Glutathione S-transferase n=1 Tax=Cajanus cajan TaxID=3821 RepID=A0A151RHM1_CAJCA|nr:glutathione S-transferase U9 [Cajanus cajan]KYP42094.1 Glutathione S-transferase 103-1A family [Cajanus cajan]